MWYIKRKKGSPQFLSIYGGWRNLTKKPTVPSRDMTKPVIQQWKEEFEQFKTQREADEFLREKGRAFQHAITVNGLITTP